MPEVWGQAALWAGLALGLIFAPFTIKTLIFSGTSLAVFLILPRMTPAFFKRYCSRASLTRVSTPFSSP